MCVSVCVCECVRVSVKVRVVEFETFSPRRESSNVICHCPFQKKKKNSNKFSSPSRHLLKSHDAKEKLFKKILEKSSKRLREERRR